MEHTDVWWLFRSPKTHENSYNYMALTAFTTLFYQLSTVVASIYEGKHMIIQFPHFPPGAMTGIGSSKPQELVGQNEGKL